MSHKSPRILFKVPAAARSPRCSAGLHSLFPLRLFVLFFKASPLSDAHPLLLAPCVLSPCRSTFITSRGLSTSSTPFTSCLHEKLKKCKGRKSADHCCSSHFIVTLGFLSALLFTALHCWFFFSFQQNLFQCSMHDSKTLILCGFVHIFLLFFPPNID